MTPLRMHTRGSGCPRWLSALLIASLSVSLSLPTPALAMRQTEMSEQQAGLEELEGALGRAPSRRPAAGLEEGINIRSWDLSHATRETMSDGTEAYRLPPAGLDIPIAGWRALGAFEGLRIYLSGRYHVNLVNLYGDNRPDLPLTLAVEWDPQPKFSPGAMMILLTHFPLREVLARETPINIGRQPPSGGVQIVVDETFRTVSRDHIMIELRGDGPNQFVHLRDRTSTNGTFIPKEAALTIRTFLGGPRPVSAGLQRKLVAHGDVHGELKGFRENLRAAGLIDDQGRWIGGNAILVQVGDVIDRGPQTRQAFDFLRTLQDAAAQAGGVVVRLGGNHELMLLQEYLQYALDTFIQVEKLSPDDAQREANALRQKIREDILSGRMVGAYVAKGYLFTHAGSRSAIREQIQQEVAQHEVIPEDHVTLEQIAQRINKLFKDAVQDDDFSHPIFQVGVDRGGQAEVGGVFWGDYGGLAHSIGAGQIDQVVGHTPLGEIRHTASLSRINVDAGLAGVYGGHQAFLVMENGQIKVVSKTGSGYSEQVVGEYPEEPIPSPEAPRPAAGLEEAVPISITEEREGERKSLFIDLVGVIDQSEPSVTLQRKPGPAAEPVGYVIPPPAAGLALVLARLEKAQGTYYVVVERVEQAQALIAAGVPPSHVVPVIATDSEEARQVFRALGITGVNVPVVGSVARGLQVARAWLRVIHGVTPRIIQPTLRWATEAPALVQQVTQWLDGQGWVPQGLTPQLAETIARLNGMA